jgi:hypothetical protein
MYSVLWGIMTQNSINNSSSSLTVDNLFVDGNTISTTNTNGDLVLAPDGSGVISVTAAPVVPSGDRADSLGSATNSWDNVYADGLTFDDGSNIISIYEPGTWTPVLKFGGGSTGITYTNQIGTYIRIGVLIYFYANITLSSKGSSTGVATLSGLPYSNSSSTARNSFLRLNTNFNGWPTDTDVYWNLLPTSSTTLSLYASGPSTTTQLVNTDFQNTSDFSVVGFYWVS